MPVAKIVYPLGEIHLISSWNIQLFNHLLANFVWQYPWHICLPVGQVLHHASHEIHHDPLEFLIL